MNEYAAFWKNYVDFSNRTSVKGFWIPVLINFVIGFVLGSLGNHMGLFAILANLFSLASLIPGLAISVRRLRDAGKHWAWIFINFIPLVGQIICIVFWCKPTASSQGQQV